MSYMPGHFGSGLIGSITTLFFIFCKIWPRTWVSHISSQLIGMDFTMILACCNYYF